MKHPLYSVAEAAHLLNKPYQPVWYAVTTRRTKARKVGRSWILNQRNLEELARYFAGLVGERLGFNASDYNEPCGGSG
jgi:hypothetical protein